MADMKARSWSDLDSRQQAGVVGLAAVQLTLLAAALTDIARRPADRIRGPKWGWALASFVNFVGPVSYFTVGRRRG